MHDTLAQIGNRQLCPLGKLEVFLVSCPQSCSQEQFGFPLVSGIEDGAHQGSNHISGPLTGNELTGILLQVQLAALPAPRGQHRLPGSLESRVGVGNDQLHSLQATGKKVFETPSPIDLCFGCGNLAAQHATLARGFDPNGTQDGAIDDSSLQADLLVAGVQEEIGHLAQAQLAPSLELLIEPRSGATHLG
jgi:hypothetical protein